ncbi:MAG: asparaginase domain-containing protein [Pseudomonadales bacterium]|jgi:L-asparaginase
MMKSVRCNQMGDGLEAILVLTTGGTIDKVYFDDSSDYEVGESVVGDLLRQADVREAFVVSELLRKDSLDMTEDDRAVIRAAVDKAPEQRIIVTHGTDTMTDSARALVPQHNKTVVLTGSLAPARFAQTDAVFNVGMAFAAVQALPAGVYIVMNGQIFDGTRVRKDLQQNAFLRT